MRGSVLDLIVIMIILGVGMFGLLIASEVLTQLDDSEMWPTNDAGTAAKTGAEDALSAINFAFPLLLVGLVVAVIIGAFMIRTHPIFFVLSLIILALTVVVSAPLSNAFMGVATSDVLQDEANTYTVATHTVGNFPIIVVVAGFIIMIALFAKPGGQQV